MAKNISDKKSSVENLIYRQISFWLSIGGLAFGAFIYLSRPSQDNSTAIQLQQQRIEDQQKTIDSITKTQQNDTQEVKAAVKDLAIQMQFYSNEIVKLETIINERIPAKTK